jgi:hypothetical protein
MLRILLTVIVPIVLPLLLYLGYVRLVRRPQPAGKGEDAEDWQKGPWVWLLLAGAGLAIAALVALDMTTGVPPGTKLQSPYLENGKIVPSRRLDDEP